MDDVRSPSQRSLVIIGASYAADWKRPALPGYLVSNKGIGGEETSDLRERFQSDVVAQKPDAVLIWGHYNDIVRAPPDHLAQVKEATRQNYRTMIDQARAAGIDVLLATEITMPIGDTWKDQLMALIGRVRGKEDYRTRINRDVKEINQWLRNYAQKHDLTLLDFELALNSDNGTREMAYSQPDGSHISPEGYEALTSFSARALRDAD